MASDSQQVADELLKTLFSIRRTGRRVAGRPTEFASLTGAQLELVRLVRRRSGVSVAEAASELLLAPNTVSTLVRQLTEAGIVVRAVDGADRRVARLELAPVLRRKVNAWRDRRVVALGASVTKLSAAQQRHIVDALPALAELAQQFEASA